MIRATLSAILLAFSAMSLHALPRDVDTPADEIHPDIHQKVGGGTNANPRGANDGGGNIHGIGNVPGQAGGDKPNADGVKGQANELETTHGGIGAKKPPPWPNEVC